jgi:hypothetical protein
VKPAGAARGDAWLWAGVALAFSPALFELLAHWRDEVWARSSALALYFVLRCAAARPADPPRRAAGLAALGSGLALEIAALAAGPEPLARVGFALGLLGAALFAGRPPLRVALLFLALVPVPFALQSALDPVLRPLLEKTAALLASALAAPTDAVALGLQQGERVLRVYATDLGLPVAALLAAAAWARGARRGSPLGPALAATAAAGVLGLGIQLAALAGAGLVLAGPGEAPARRVLEHAPPLLAVACALALFELPRRTGARAR